MINPNDITTIRVGELPPNIPTLESKIPHELGTDLNYFTIQQLIAFLQPYVGVFQYETKRLAVNQAYITDNFDETGLGKNICLGWAIRNGNNGTDNIDGKVGVAYGASNNVIGQTSGSRDAVVVAHSHLVFSSGTTAVSNVLDGTGYPVVDSSGTGWGNDSYTIRKSNTAPTLGKTATLGVSGTDKNMQPYIIDLYIMKL